jgi:adenosylhomocysteine nucleosidase
MSRIAIVAALEREIVPLVKNWKSRLLCRGRDAGPQCRLYENKNAALICAGIGPDAARRAAALIIRETGARRIVSVGFAGALDPALKVGNLIEPRTVINGEDSSRIDTGSGQGTLISAIAVAGKEQKQKLRQAYAADAVDMEAAAVALSAQAAQVEFSAFKVISDEVDFAMPPMGKFVQDDGQFNTSRFVRHISVRPHLWGPTWALGRNSRVASEALCAALPNYLDRLATRDNIEHL